MQADSLARICRLIVPEKWQKRDKKCARERASERKRGGTEKSPRPRCIYAFACVRVRGFARCTELRRGLERGSLCSLAFTAAFARTLSLVHSREYTHTVETGSGRYIYCNKLRCTYVQRALHVTHMLAYATGSRPVSVCRSLRLIPPLSVGLLSFLLACYSIYLALSLAPSFVDIYYIHTDTYGCAYIRAARVSFCPLCSSLCRPTSLSFSSVGECTYSSVQIYIYVYIRRAYIQQRPSAHTRETTKSSACGCWPRARCTFCSQRKPSAFYTSREPSKLYALL